MYFSVFIYLLLLFLEEIDLYWKFLALTVIQSDQLSDSNLLNQVTDKI